MTPSAVVSFAGRAFLDVDDVPQALEQRFHIFDVRFDLDDVEYGMKQFAKSHLPGAHYANLDKHLSGPVTAQTGRHPLPECADFVAWCCRHGLQDRRPVLCYDEECGTMAACRLWWMLHNLGVEAYVLNGGIQAYTHALHAASQAHGQAHLPALESGPAVMPNGKDDASAWPFATHFTRCYALDAIPPAATIADIRASFRFHTTVRPYCVDPVPGHMKGALNIPCHSFFTRQEGVAVLKAEDILRKEMLHALHTVKPTADSFDDCVLHCGSGVSACVALALIHHLNLGNPHLYVGSWSQYANVHRFTLLRHIIEEHGFFCEILCMMSHDDAKAVCDSSTILVDGELRETLDEEIRTAIPHLHVGEKARVHFKSGRVALLEVLQQNSSSANA